MSNILPCQGFDTTVCLHFHANCIELQQLEYCISLNTHWIIVTNVDLVTANYGINVVILMKCRENLRDLVGHFKL